VGERVDNFPRFTRGDIRVLIDGPQDEARMVRLSSLGSDFGIPPRWWIADDLLTGKLTTALESKLSSETFSDMEVLAWAASH